MQERHPHDYNQLDQSRKSGWRKNGKRLSQDWVYVWAVINPKTNRVNLLMSDDDSDAPTRVQPIETWFNRDRLRWLQGDPDGERQPLDDGEKWRTFCIMVDSGRIGMTEKNHGSVDSTYLEALIEREIEENE